MEKTLVPADAFTGSSPVTKLLRAAMGLVTGLLLVAALSGSVVAAVGANRSDQSFVLVGGIAGMAVAAAALLLAQAFPQAMVSAGGVAVAVGLYCLAFPLSSLGDANSIVEVIHWGGRTAVAPVGAAVMAIALSRLGSKAHRSRQ